MRTIVATLGLASVIACQRPVDVTGLYANRTNSPRLSHAGLFFACDGPDTPWLVQDSALAARYSTVVSRPRSIRVRAFRGSPGGLRQHLRGSAVPPASQDSGSSTHETRRLPEPGGFPPRAASRLGGAGTGSC